MIFRVMPFFCVVLKNEIDQNPANESINHDKQKIENELFQAHDDLQSTEIRDFGRWACDHKRGKTVC